MTIPPITGEDVTGVGTFDPSDNFVIDIIMLWNKNHLDYIEKKKSKCNFENFATLNFTYYLTYLLTMQLSILSYKK